MEKYLLTVKEVIEYTGIGQNRIYELIKKGDIKAVKVGRYNRIHRLELEKFLDEAVREGIQL
ncbi:excisionase family DNA binding protein [Acetoanaerobium pronyense]|uniref:Excisionase family DNA binding protein n=1 Tax=Acetoanaerobium pronyense TaxID=1482736 RepID=A0ABS4KI37_9FIRM|nr:helix-turn-helix domain-containing protein [Acetoanaerobium pronyense]MBP2027445.1 excisionase family DNA binding protein [Acetoanaerobium pronyense]